MYLKKLKIGNVTLKNNILLAPMAGITNLPFRIICEKFNPGLVCTEMVSSKGLFYDDKKTEKLLNMKNEKRPVAVQIFGNDIEAMAYSAKKVSKIANLIDINMGCPAPKVVKNGDGSKLMLDIELSRKIIQAVVENSSVPVTVKIRKGWDKEHINCIEFAKMAEQAGACAITIHGRTRDEFYSGTADWEIIKKLKQEVSIPVIGNGDIKSPQDALKMFEYAGVDGIMIGRAAIGNPWIFMQIQEYLKNGKMIEISNEKRLKIILEHINLQVEELGENTGIKEMRKHMTYYIKGLKDSSAIRQKMKTYEYKLKRISTYSLFLKPFERMIIWKRTKNYYKRNGL